MTQSPATYAVSVNEYLPFYRYQRHLHISRYFGKLPHVGYMAQMEMGAVYDERAGIDIARPGIGIRLGLRHIYSVI